MSESPATLRKNGFVFACAFALLAFGARREPALAAVLFAAGLATLAVAIAKPALLERPTRVWLRLGAAMHKVVNPIVLGVLYVVLIIPAGIMRRIAAGDAMKRRKDPALRTYWVECERRTYTLEDFRHPY
ncbi:MAG TPA: SxtJ family membrane protein [Usitatibacter sp.]|jgi:hypothetical protein|nr:SxtJ family membrane protein [Usitatibacter sp.]